MSKILITSALPYANGSIHFGHIAGAYLPADIYARFERMQKNDVLFICGSDEYGIAIVMSAEKAGKSCKEHVDFYHEKNKALFEKMAISFDHYSRTTWDGHIEPTHAFFLALLEKGYIEKKETEQLFSEKENRFLADRYVIGECPKCGFEAARGDECTRCGQSFDATDLKNPRSKMTGAHLTLKKTTHWFLRLDLFSETLLEWIEKKNWKANVKNFAKQYIKDLKPRAITRDSGWGVPVPVEGGEGKVLYVWFDAPIGYISATKEYGQLQNDPELYKRYWQDDKTHLVQFVGKDNIPFHAAIFPAMTMGQNEPYKVVDELSANEFLNLEGRQFSKSDGWYIDLESFLERYSVDQIRYYLAANAPEMQDSEFTWRDFQARSNADLVGKFGNFINRTMVFICSKLDGKIPQKGTLLPEDSSFVEVMNEKVETIKVAYSEKRSRLACQLIMELAQAANGYFDMKKPWVLLKDETKKEALATMLHLCLEAMKNLSVISYPIMPDSAMKIWKMLGQKDVLQKLSFDELKAYPLEEGLLLEKPELLFTKLEDDQIEKEIQMLVEASTKEEKVEDPMAEETKEMPLISFDEAKKLDLRVAKVLEAEKIKKSKKLLKLTVDVGSDVRTIVSGIAEKYTPEDMVGKHVVIVKNLQPAKLMGVESKGMILAGGDGDTLKVLELNDLPPGTEVG